MRFSYSFYTHIYSFARIFIVIGMGFGLGMWFFLPPTFAADRVQFQIIPESEK